jgi:hypothetical protein
MACGAGGSLLLRSPHHELSVFTGLIFLTNARVAPAAHDRLFGGRGNAIRWLVPGRFPMRLALAVAGVAGHASGEVGVLLKICGRLVVARAANFV